MNRTVRCFDPRIKSSYSVSAYIMAGHSLIRAENLSSACVKSLQFADIRFTLFVPLFDCKSAATIPKLEGSHMA